MMHAPDLILHNAKIATLDRSNPRATALAVVRGKFTEVGQAVTPKATDFRLVKVENSGHFMQEEQPEVVARSLVEFFN